MYVWSAGMALQRRARSTSHLFHSLTSSFLFEVGAEVQKAGLTMVGLEAIFESADAAAATCQRVFVLTVSVVLVVWYWRWRCC